MPPAYGSFLSAITGASATIVGLLFVALTIDPERVRHQAAADRQLSAALAFYALLDPLLVGLLGLLPGDGIAGTARIFGSIGIVLTLGIARAARARRRQGGRPLTDVTSLSLSGLVYVAQVAISQVLLEAPGRGWAEADLAGCLSLLLVVGILRSWGLLGMGRGSTAALRLLTGRAPDDPATIAAPVAEGDAKAVPERP